MKRKLFRYKKTESEISQRDVLITNENVSFFDGIDLSYLSEEEKDQLIKLNDDFEKAVEPFIKKAFRRFSKIKVLTE